MKRNPIEPFKIVKIRKIKQGKNISTPIKKEKEKDESIEDKRRNNKEKDNKILKKFSEKDKSETNNTIKIFSENRIYPKKEFLIKPDLINQYKKKVKNYSSEGFSQETESYLRKMASNPKFGRLSTLYPLLRIFKYIAKIFYINSLELTFWSCFLEKNELKFSELQPYSYDYPDIFNLLENNIENKNEGRCLIFYLTLSAFAVKQNLNDYKEIEMIEQILYEKHPYFNMIFKEWIEKNKKDLSFSPLDLNTVYKKYQFKSNESEFLLNNDYNSLVDAIILIAPSYDKTLTAEINNDHETNQIKTNQMIENIDNIEESNLLPISYQTRSQSNNYLINQNFYNNLMSQLSPAVSHEYSNDMNIESDSQEIPPPLELIKQTSRLSNKSNNPFTSGNLPYLPLKRTGISQFINN